MNRNPFESLAFLSGLPRTSVGAGQSAALWPHPPSGHGALWPHPPSGNAALWPIEPDAWAALAALWPVPPRANAAQWPVPPKKLGPASDEGAVRVDAESLLNEALRKSRVKIVRRSDAGDGAVQAIDADASLWRWAPDSRIKTVSCELMQRFMVVGRSLWLLNPGAAEKPGDPMPISAQGVFELPDTTKVDWQKQVDKVIRAAIEREDRLPEILTQASDFWPFFESITGIHLERAPRLAELMAVVQDTAVHLVMLLKEVAREKRPVERSSRVMPVIATPGHGSLPSGHATLAALTSELLYLLMYQGDDQKLRSQHLDRLARRIAFNRVVAGVHFPVDSQVGYALGTQLARLFASLADSAAKPPKPLTADDVAKNDRDLSELPDGGETNRPPGRPDDSYKVSPTDTWRKLWSATVAELRDLRV